MRDTVNMLREGVPAVALVHEPFRRLARMAAGQVGMPDAPLLIYPRDLVAEESPQDLEAKACEVAAAGARIVLDVGKG
ncbi:MAG: hypothetical protein JO352_08520 [Chloroflexi bacterium]|nr:hypothetical protein [Chloroflexota bacterium]MBV9602984.1 hypothetical protein [Chloroflexota bacterium]